MENEIKTISSKDKFFEMREKEQSIEENPIRYGREQFFKGKMAAYDRIERLIAESMETIEEGDQVMMTVYQHMQKMIALYRRTES